MKKKKIIAITGFIFILLIGIIIFYNKANKPVYKSNNDKFDTSSMFTYMLETSRGSGEYKVATDSKWPSGYEYNATLSYCENGSTLLWNSSNSVTVNVDVSDKCYLYFDVLPPDVTVNTNNTGNTYNASTPALLSCSGATSSYNQKYQRIEISQINNKYTTCNLTYQTPSSKTYLNNKIIGLSGQTQGTGQVVNENGYRYEGKNPNNYIWFNNELWRIIGVFDSASHGQSGNLVKIIREESIGALAWHKSNTNDWSASSLNKLLNNYYYNSLDGTNSGYCYGYKNTILKTCDYREIGINSVYRNMIQNVKWYLGESDGYNNNSQNYYNNERDESLVSGDRASFVNAYVGLIYLSDYGFSVLANSCPRSTKIDDYDTNSCAGNSWLYWGNYQWTLTINYSSVYYYSDNANYALSVGSGFSIRPSLYLKSNVYVISGNGSMNNPYVIGI